MEETDAKTDENGVYIVIKNDGKSPRLRYKARSVKIMSIVHLVCGSVTFLVDIVKILATYENDENALAGFCSSLFITTGIFGLISLKGTSSCKISTFMVLSILSSIFGAFLFLTGLHILYSNQFVPGGYIQDDVIYLSFGFCGLMEFILGIVSSAFSCHACCTCCGGVSGDAEESTVVYIATPEEGDIGKPRVVHLNMNEIRKQKSNDQPIVQEIVEPKEETNGNTEEENCNSKGYARFK